MLAFCLLAPSVLLVTAGLALSFKDGKKTRRGRGKRVTTGKARAFLSDDTRTGGRRQALP